MSIRTRRFLNRPESAVQEMLEGYTAAHSDIIRLSDGLVVRAVPKPQGHVGVVIGNGSGHEPAMIGWVGEGLFDVNVPGPVFSSPGPDGILRGIKAADHGGGVLLLVSSHAGDIMNASLAISEAEDEGIRDVEMVVLYDDVASAPKDRITERRGGAGLFFVWKTVGAMAERGGSLQECSRIARKTRDRTRSLSAAVGTVAHPVSGQPLGDPRDTSVSVGMGVHGEPGARLGEDVQADEISGMMIERLVDDAGLDKGDRVGLLLNNAGSLTLMELSILYRGAASALAARGIETVRSWIGPYATTLDMAGFAFAVCNLDDELLDLYDAPARGAGLTLVREAGDPALIDRALAARLISAAFRAVAEHQDELSRLDAVAGDGDHGVNMSVALAEAERRACDPMVATAAAVFESTGRSFHQTVGGSAGALFGAFFGALSSWLDKVTVPETADLVAGLRKGLDRVSRLGGAAPGHKTMVDALSPALEAAEDMVAQRASMARVMDAAAEAAKRGAESTAAMHPKAGRARYAPERSLGSEDPGAMTVALILEAWAEELSDR